MSIQLRNGLIAGLLGSLAYITAIQYSLGNTLNPFININILGIYLSLLLLLVMTILQVKKMKEGAIDFSEGMKAGLAVTIVAGLVISIIVYIYFKWINHDWFIIQSAYWKKEGKIIPQKFTPSQISVIVMVVNNIPGALMTLILSLILKSSSKK